MRVLAVVVATGLLVSGCLAHQGAPPASRRGPSRSWLVFLHDVPLARVTSPAIPWGTW